jgi:YhgE/Pip-like protein
MPNEPSTLIRRPLANPRLWAFPIVVVVIVAGFLSAMYLGGTINSSTSLKGFPIAIVDQDQPVKTPGGQLHAGKQIADNLVSGIDHDKFAVSRLTLAQAEARMDKGTLYGAIVLPSTLSARLVGLAESTTSASAATKPTITVLTNPRAGTATPGIVTTLATAALAKVDTAVGSQLITSTRAQLVAAGHPEALTGAAVSLLAAPITIVVTAHDALPEGTGGGLSAFYFALLLVLAGFTGSMIVSTLVDGSLGFVPSEFGPAYSLARHSGLSRRATLGVKWAIMAVLALVVAALYLAVSAALGMPISHPFLLWAFSAAAILAVALVAQTIIAIFGSIGLIVNLFVFVIFSLPSAGGTIPLEATPALFRWLGSFEPMHQIYLGARAILYFDGTLDAGLGRALIFCAAAAVLGVVIGLIATTIYDRRKLQRRGDWAPAEQSEMSRSDIAAAQ